MLLHLLLMPFAVKWCSRREAVALFCPSFTSALNSGRMESEWSSIIKCDIELMFSDSVILFLVIADSIKQYGVF